MVTDRIIEYLTNREWRVTNETSDFLCLSAPEGFGLPPEYSLIIPKTSAKTDFKRYYENLLKIFSDFYNLSSQEFNAMLEEEDSILRVRIHDDSTADGKINFVRFEGFIEKLKAIITDTACFVIDKKLFSTRVPAEVQRYLNKCHFLQTDKGSYVTKIQLPSKDTIKDADLFSPQILAKEINGKLLEVLDYVSTQIFHNNIGPVTDEYLIENESKLNIRLLRDIETLYEKSDIKNIDFSLHSVQETKVVISENITKEQIHRLSLFIDEVNNKSFETKQATVKGKIEALKSKDPDGGRNSITIQGLHEDLPVVAIANLSSSAYKEAIEAHRMKEYVTITGMAKITRTRIHFIAIDHFQVG